MKKRWVNNLPEDVYLRLCECRSVKSDLPILVDTRWKWMQEQGFCGNRSKADAVDLVLELLDCNFQEYLTELTTAEYQELCAEK